MRARTRSCVVAALLLLAAGAAAPSAAATPAGPACGGGGYGAPVPCAPEVEVEPRCEDGTPVLRYAVAPADGVTVVGVTFVGAGGAELVLADQPLAGAVAWPDGPEWATGAVEVRIATADDVQTSVVVDRTPAQACERAEVLAAGPDPVAAPRERAEVLAATGGTVGPLVLVAAGLGLAGLAGVLAARDHRRRVTGARRRG